MRNGYPALTPVYGLGSYGRTGTSITISSPRTRLGSQSRIFSYYNSRGQGQEYIQYLINALGLGGIPRSPNSPSPPECTCISSDENEIRFLKNSPPNLNPFIPQKNGIYLGEAFKEHLGEDTRLSTSNTSWFDPSTNMIDLSNMPWVNGAVCASYYNTSCDPVPGSIFVIKEDDNYRYLMGNGIPNTPMGIFPVQPWTEAYKYYSAAPGGHDPRTGYPGSDYSSAAAIGVSPYPVNIRITKNPQVNDTPSPINYIIIGYTLTGAAWHAEIANDASDNWYNPVSILPPDYFGGHPYEQQYHLHAYSWRCLLKEQIYPSPLLGYALDGFGIYGPYDKDGNMITNDQLDECHGLTSEVMWEGEMTNIYHYVCNTEYPYCVGAFRGTVNYDEVLRDTQRATCCLYTSPDDHHSHNHNDSTENEEHNHSTEDEEHDHSTEPHHD